MSKKIQAKKEVYLIAYNIRSLFNVGSFFRTADAFGVKKIFLCGITGFPPRREISKVALGAEETVLWERHRQAAQLIKKLKKQGVKIVSLELTKKAKPLSKFKPKFPLALVVGNEVGGVSRNILKLSDSVVYIPMQGKKESLNVSVAAGVALFHLTIS